MLILDALFWRISWLYGRKGGRFYCDGCGRYYFSISFWNVLEGQVDRLSLVLIGILSYKSFNIANMGSSIILA